MFIVWLVFYNAYPMNMYVSVYAWFKECLCYKYEVDMRMLHVYSTSVLYGNMNWFDCLGWYSVTRLYEINSRS